MLLSVIISSLNEVSNIQQSVSAAHRDYTSEEVEVIVVDGGSSDGTLDLIPEDVMLVKSPMGRGVQMNRGVSASRGQILVFCHADSQLPSGCREAVVDALDQPGVSGGTFQTLSMPEQGIILWLRNRIVFGADWRIMFEDQAQFMTRTTFELVGGFLEIPLMEDVEIPTWRGQTRQNSTYRVITSSRRLIERGAILQLLFNVWSMVRYLYLGVMPEDIARAYRPNRKGTQ